MTAGSRSDEDVWDYRTDGRCRPHAARNFPILICQWPVCTHSQKWTCWCIYGERAKNDKPWGVSGGATGHSSTYQDIIWAMFDMTTTQGAPITGESKQILFDKVFAQCHSLAHLIFNTGVFAWPEGNKTQAKIISDRSLVSPKPGRGYTWESGHGASLLWFGPWVRKIRQEIGH